VAQHTTYSFLQLVLVGVYLMYYISIFLLWYLLAGLHVAHLFLYSFYSDQFFGFSPDKGDMLHWSRWNLAGRSVPKQWIPCTILTKFMGFMRVLRLPNSAKFGCFSWTDNQSYKQLEGTHGVRTHAILLLTLNLTLTFEPKTMSLVGYTIPVQIFLWAARWHHNRVQNIKLWIFWFSAYVLLWFSEQRV